MSKPILLIECEPDENRWDVFTEALFDFAAPRIVAFNGTDEPKVKRTLVEVLNTALDLQQTIHHRHKQIVVISKQFSDDTVDLFDPLTDDQYMVITNDLDAIAATLKYS